MFDDLAETARRSLVAEGVPAGEQQVHFQMDIRYRGQGMQLTVDVERDVLAQDGLVALGQLFDQKHTQLYTFALSVPHEIVNLRAVVQGPQLGVLAKGVGMGGGTDCSEARLGTTSIYVDGADWKAIIYDRSKLKSGNRLLGPAVITQMDTTTLILPGHTGEVDTVGNILIRPNV